MSNRTNADLRKAALLDAPCMLCGYNGAGYWQSGTHEKSCPWRGLGGMSDRGEALPLMIASLRSERTRLLDELDEAKRLLETANESQPGREPGSWQNDVDAFLARDTKGPDR